MLGLRADATPQVARIDAHILNRKGVARLCYAGSVLHARPLHPLAPREPLQVGAELYGLSGPDADAEVVEHAPVPRWGCGEAPPFSG
jgi:ATP phosphoribosyltransferase regulatory subunit